MTLYICEKPSQARDIARLLNCSKKGEGYLSNGAITVSWCFGHLVETAEPSYYCQDIKPWSLGILPIIPDEWHLQIKASCKKQFNILKDLIKSAKTIVVATDADREGELIAREVLTLCKYKGEIKRLWLSALDDLSIQKAIQEIRDGKTTESLYYAGLGRQRADWLIGMNMTMATSVLFGKYGEGVLSVGRVQTPTLKLIVDRDLAIENFKSKDYFELTAQFTTQNNQSFYAKWQPPKNECDEEGRCLNKNIVTSFAQKVRGKTGTIEQFEDKQASKSAPLCLSLSQLQKLASSQFGLSAQKTLDIAQSLYETHKAITYPRTDCGYLPENQFNEAKIILKNLKQINEALSELIAACDTSFRTPTWNDKKITAHHGIIPTLNSHVDRLKMREDEKQIYDLICRYFIAQFLGDYEYAHRSVSVICEGELFKATSNSPIKPGWQRALKNLVEKEETENDDHLSIIPLLQLNESVTHTDEKLLSKKTQPPARFTEGSLIGAMKSISKLVQDEKYKKILKDTAGIGTEATRANIIETLYKRGFIEKKGKQVFSTQKGRQLISYLPPVVCDPILTAEWEQALDSVSQGQLKLESFLHQQTELLQTMLAAIKSLAPAKSADKPLIKSEIKKTPEYHCLECSKLMIRRKSAKKNKYFWGCSQFPSCRYTATDKNGAPIMVVPPLV